MLINSITTKVNNRKITIQKFMINNIIKFFMKSSIENDNES